MRDMMADALDSEQAFGRDAGIVQFDDNRKLPARPALKVLNIWAGPGAGKSTTAAALFNLMKRERFEVEIIPEVAKAMSYAKQWSQLDNQLLVLAKQENQLRQLIGQVEYAIVDSPFPMGLIYSNYEDHRLDTLITCLWDDYDNFNFSLQRTRKPFQKYGRHHNYEQAVELDAKIADLLIYFDDAPGRDVVVVDPDDPAVEYRMLDALLMAQGKAPLGDLDPRVQQ